MSWQYKLREGVCVHMYKFIGEVYMYIHARNGW